MRHCPLPCASLPFTALNGASQQRPSPVIAGPRRKSSRLRDKDFDSIGSIENCRKCQESCRKTLLLLADSSSSSEEEDDVCVGSELADSSSSSEEMMSAPEQLDQHRPVEKDTVRHRLCLALPRPFC